MKLLTKRNIVILIVCIVLVPVGLFSKTYINAYEIKSGLSLGNKYLSEGKYEEAVLQYNRVIGMDSKNIDARLGLANTYIKEGKLSVAESVLKDVIKLDSKLGTVYTLLSTVYQKEDKLIDASNLLSDGNKLVDLSTDMKYIDTIRASKLVYDTALKQMEGKDYLSAINNFTKVIDTDVIRYKDSRLKIGECKKIYITSMLLRGKAALNNKDFVLATTSVTDILKEDASNSEALKLQTSIASDVKSQKDIVDAKAKQAELESHPIIYTNSKYSFQLTIPSSWKGKYIVETTETDNVAANDEPAYHSTRLDIKYIISDKSLDNGAHDDAAYYSIFQIDISSLVRPRDDYTPGYGEGSYYRLTTFNGKDYSWSQGGDPGLFADSRYYNESLLYANMLKGGSIQGVMNSFKIIK